MKESIKEALQELNHIEAQQIHGTIGRLTSSDINVIILDFNPTTNKVLLALVDTEYPPSIKERHLQQKP